MAGGQIFLLRFDKCHRYGLGPGISSEPYSSRHLPFCHRKTLRHCKVAGSNIQKLPTKKLVLPEWAVWNLFEILWALPDNLPAQVLQPDKPSFSARLRNERR
jgi:hypothetical protein